MSGPFTGIWREWFTATALGRSTTIRSGEANLMAFALVAPATWISIFIPSRDLTTETPFTCTGLLAASLDADSRRGTAGVAAGSGAPVEEPATGDVPVGAVALATTAPPVILTRSVLLCSC